MSEIIKCNPYCIYFSKYENKLGNTGFAAGAFCGAGETEELIIFVNKIFEPKFTNNLTRQAQAQTAAGEELGSLIENIPCLAPDSKSIGA